LLLPHLDPLRKRPFPPSEISHNGKAMYPNRIRNKLTIVIYVNDFLRREEKAVKNQCVEALIVGLRKSSVKRAKAGAIRRNL
jgi:hypothetical protein